MALGFGERQARRYLREPDLRKSDQEANRKAVVKHRDRPPKLGQAKLEPRSSSSAGSREGTGTNGPASRNPGSCRAPSTASKISAGFGRKRSGPVTAGGPACGSASTLHRMVKRPLHVEFVDQALTSYSGLELLRRYLRQCDLPSRLRAACAATGGDYGGGRLALLVLALLYTGARRLEHLRYLAHDPLIARFCGLARIPTARTLANWLRQFTLVALAPLVQLNHDLEVSA